MSNFCTRFFLPRLAVCSLPLLAVLPAVALAGPEPAPTVAVDQREPDAFLRALIAFDANHYFDSDFDGSNVGFSVSRYSYYGEFKFRLSPVFLLKLFTYADYSLYSFKNLPPPSPAFSNLLRGAVLAQTDLTLAYQFAPGWAIVGGGRLTTGSATSADFANSFTGGGILAIKKSFFNGGIDFTIGASYTTRLSRSAHFFPYVDFDVNVLPSFVTIPVNVRLLHNGGIVSYRVTDQLSLMVEGRYDTRDYRLNRNSLVLPGAVWSEYGVDLGAGFGWTPKKKNWSVSVFGGYEVFRNVQVFNYSGQKVFDRDVKPAPYMSADFHASF